MIYTEIIKDMLKKEDYKENLQLLAISVFYNTEEEAELKQQQQQYLMKAMEEAASEIKEEEHQIFLKALIQKAKEKRLQQ